MRPVRWIVIGVIVLGVGALTNEAIIRVLYHRLSAWGYSATASPTEWPITVPGHWPRTPERSEFEMQAGFDRRVARFVTQNNYYGAQLVRAGWPCRSFCFEHFGEQNPIAASNIDQMSLRWLPHSPLWPGLIANSAFLGSAIVLLPMAAYRLSRYQVGRIRFNKGLCISCGYPEGVSTTCTECGVRHPPRTT